MATKTDRLLTLLSYSFGFNLQESRHHFLVKIPRGAQQEIQISEHFTWTEQIGSSAATLGMNDDGQKGGGSWEL